ncbi:MAG: hypothetical protein QXY45_02265 [Candidatus Aenigmatarchaeota archaeon]
MGDGDSNVRMRVKKINYNGGTVYVFEGDVLVIGPNIAELMGVPPGEYEVPQYYGGKYKPQALRRLINFWPRQNLGK